MTTERLTFGHPSGALVRRRGTVSSTAVLADEPAPVRLSVLATWDWAWGGLLLFTVFLFFRPQDQLGLKNTNISDGIAIVGLVAMVMMNVSRGRPPIRVTAELLGVAALGAVMLATVATAYWPGGAFAVFMNAYITLALIFLLMVNTVTSPKRIERICWVIVLAFGVMSARVVFNYVRGVGLIEGNRAIGPGGGFFENPNDLALNLVVFLPLALMFVKRPGPLSKRVLAAAISGLMLVALVCTKSRGGTLGAVAMLVTFLVVSRSLTPASLIALVLAGMLVLPALPSAFWERMASITDARKDPTGSRAERKILLEHAWQTFVQYPLTGVGAGQFQNFYIEGLGTRWRETHNALLQVAAELGLFGLIAFCFLIVRAFWAAHFTRRSLSWIYLKRRRGRAPPAATADGLEPDERHFLQTHGAAMVASVVGWFVTAMFLSVAYGWTFFYVLGLAAVGRDVIRHRAAALAEARRHGETRVVLA